MIKFWMFFFCRTKKVLTVWWNGNKTKQKQKKKTASDLADSVPARTANKCCRDIASEKGWWKRHNSFYVLLTDLIGSRTRTCRCALKIHRHLLKEGEDVYSCLSNRDCLDGLQHPPRPWLGSKRWLKEDGRLLHVSGSVFSAVLYFQSVNSPSSTFSLTLRSFPHTPKAEQPLFIHQKYVHKNAAASLPQNISHQISCIYSICKSFILKSVTQQKLHQFKFCKRGCTCLIQSTKDVRSKRMTLNNRRRKEKKNRDSESKNHLGDKQLLHVVQYLEDLVTVCSNIVPWLPGLRREQSGSETDSESSVSSQHSVYPSVCLAVYLTVKLSLSANSSPAAQCK